MSTGTPIWKLCAAVVVMVVNPAAVREQPFAAMVTLFAPSVEAPVEIVMGAEAAESPPNMSSATILYCHVVEPFRMPCTLVMKGVAAATVVPLPMVQGLQLACLTLTVATLLATLMEETGTAAPGV